MQSKENSVNDLSTEENLGNENFSSTENQDLENSNEKSDSLSELMDWYSLRVISGKEKTIEQIGQNIWKNVIINMDILERKIYVDLKKPSLNLISDHSQKSLKQKVLNIHLH